MKIEDNSGDREFFTIIPNYIINHSTANDQALYMQMKRFAGEKGECFASEVTLRQKLGIGRNALKKSIEYLIDHKWISLKGYKKVKTTGGEQKIRVYSINNIWKVNSEYYNKGVSETAPLENKGCSEMTTRVGSNDNKGRLKRQLRRTIKKEPLKKNQLSNSNEFEDNKKINQTRKLLEDKFNFNR